MAPWVMVLNIQAQKPQFKSQESTQSWIQQHKSTIPVPKIKGGGGNRGNPSRKLMCWLAWYSHRIGQTTKGTCLKQAIACFIMLGPTPKVVL